MRWRATAASRSGSLRRRGRSRRPARRCARSSAATNTRRWPPRWRGSRRLMRKPRALRPGNRIALVAPASPFPRESFDAGVTELRRLGYDPVYDESVFARRRYVAGEPAVRAASFRRAWTDDSIAALIAVRGGYGSVHLLPLMDSAEITPTPKGVIGHSANTPILDWLVRRSGIVAFHGPMIDGRFAKGEGAYD